MPGQGNERPPLSNRVRKQKTTQDYQLSDLTPCKVGSTVVNFTQHAWFNASVTLHSRRMVGLMFFVSRALACRCTSGSQSAIVHCCAKVYTQVQAMHGKPGNSTPCVIKLVQYTCASQLNNYRPQLA